MCAHLYVFVFTHELCVNTVYVCICILFFSFFWGVRGGNFEKTQIT